MFYSLAHLEDSFHKNNTYKFLAMAPCFHTPYDFDMDRYLTTIDQFDEYGVYAFNGPNWTSDLETIKNNFNNKTYKYAAAWPGYGEAVKTEKHWIQNTLAK